MLSGVMFGVIVNVYSVNVYSVNVFELWFVLYGYVFFEM